MNRNLIETFGVGAITATVIAVAVTMNSLPTRAVAEPEPTNVVSAQAEALVVDHILVGTGPYLDTLGNVYLSSETDTFSVGDDVNVIVYLAPRGRDIFIDVDAWYGGSAYEQASHLPFPSVNRFIRLCAAASKIDSVGLGEPFSGTLVVNGQLLSTFSYKVQAVSAGNVNTTPCNSLMPITQMGS